MSHDKVLARQMRDPEFRYHSEQRKLVHEVAVAVRAMRKQGGIPISRRARTPDLRQRPARGTLSTLAPAAPGWHPPPVQTLRPAASPEDWELARALFREYEREIDAAVCFAGFERELAGLDRLYAPPEGRLLLAFQDGEGAGCGALRRLEDGVAEGRRLYLRPAFRGRGLGGALLLALLDEGRRLGFRTFRLETLPGKMSAALGLYRQVGFAEIPPYVREPPAGAIYMELPLARP